LLTYVIDSSSKFKPVCPCPKSDIYRFKKSTAESNGRNCIVTDVSLPMIHLVATAAPAIIYYLLVFCWKRVTHFFL